MKILGNFKPYTNTECHYSMMDDSGKTIKVETWQIFGNKRLLAENSKGKFSFGVNTAGKTLTLVGKVKNLKTGALVSYSTTIIPLVGTPKIIDVYWKDINGEKITNRAVGYLDKVTLVVKTINIPVGDKLKITIYEDEYADGHGESSRKMGEYLTKGVSKNEYAFIEFNNIQIYQKILNNLDHINEREHEFYLKIEYGNGKIHLIKDGIILKIKNELKQMVKPYTGVKPVVVGKPESIKKENKKPVNFTFGVFFDGTLNNMYETEVRKVAQGKKIQNASGFAIDQITALQVYQQYGNAEKKDTSYENDLSNPAILYKNYLPSSTKKIFRIYIEGIGTHSAPKEQGGSLEEKDYKANSSVQGPAFGIGNTGIINKVKKAIKDIVKELKNVKSDQKIGTITFDVFGFSRGAAAARHFVYNVTYPSYKPSQSMFRGD